MINYQLYSNNKQTSKLSSFIQEGYYFIRDVISAFLFFALHPFQYLFLNSPKVYDKIVLFLSAIRNVIPTKDECIHTFLHWQYYFLLCSLLVLRKTSSYCNNLSKKTIVMVETNLTKTSIYYK